MLRILQQFILTAFFAVFASQASAMFISPDPMNPTHPGVGTNQYAYSHGDPINMSDPSGLATTFHEDGSVTHWDPDSPEHAAIACGCAAGSAYMRDRTQYYNDWRADFVSNNPGRHAFYYDTLNDGSYFVGFGEQTLANLGGGGRPGIPSTSNSLPPYLTASGFQTDRLGLSSAAITHILDRHGWRSSTDFGRVVVSPGIPGRREMVLSEIITAFPVAAGNLLNTNH